MGVSAAGEVDVPEPEHEPKPTAPGGENFIDRLEFELRQVKDLTAEKAIAIHEKLFAQILNEAGRDYLLTILRDRGWQI